MRNSLLSILLTLLTPASLLAQEEFEPAVMIKSGDAPVDVKGYRWAKPFFGDFDGDGLNDLLVGQDEGGRLRIYRNRGTNEQPRFDGYEFLRVDGEIAELPCEGEFRPQLVDFDGDGQLDILTSSWPGYIFWYKRKGDGTFNDAAILRLADGHILNAGFQSGCHATDWEGDGDMDLILVGNRSPDGRGAEVAFVENTGSPQSPKLSPPVPLKLDDVPIQIPEIYGFPFVADWNGDGRKDLLIGVWTGRVMLYENKAEGSPPTLAAPRELVPATGRPRAAGDDSIHRGSGGSLCVADWGNDGTLDILIGDEQSETIQPELTDEKERLAKARQEAAQVLREYRQMRRLLRKLEGTTQENQKTFVQQTREKHAGQIEELHAEINALEQAMQPKGISHSYVWLLRRNAPPRSR